MLSGSFADLPLLSMIFIQVMRSTSGKCHKVLSFFENESTLLTFNPSPPLLADFLVPEVPWLIPWAHCLPVAFPPLPILLLFPSRANGPPPYWLPTGASPPTCMPSRRSVRASAVGPFGHSGYSAVDEISCPNSWSIQSESRSTAIEFSLCHGPGSG